MAAEQKEMKNKHLSGGLFAHGKPQPLTPDENTVSYNIEVWLNSRGIYNDRLNCGAIKTERGNWITLCKRGTPDRFAIIRGNIIFIEVKKRGAKPSGEQLIRHDQLRSSGAVVIVADSFDNFTEQFNAIRAEIEATQSGVNLYV